MGKIVFADDFWVEFEPEKKFRNPVKTIHLVTKKGMIISSFANAALPMFYCNLQFKRSWEHLLVHLSS